MAARCEMIGRACPGKEWWKQGICCKSGRRNGRGCLLIGGEGAGVGGASCRFGCRRAQKSVLSETVFLRLSKRGAWFLRRKEFYFACIICSTARKRRLLSDRKVFINGLIRWMLGAKTFYGTPLPAEPAVSVTPKIPTRPVKKKL